MKNYYELLEVSEKASQEVIKKAYTTLVKKYHPDLQPDGEKKAAEEKIKEINEAYEVLSDKIKREIYDRKLHVEKAKTENNDYSNVNLNSQKRTNNTNTYQNNSSKSNQSENNKKQTHKRVIHNPSMNNNFTDAQNDYNNIVNEIYHNAYNDAYNSAYNQAYINNLKNMGFDIQYERPFKEKVKITFASICGILVFIVICFILWHIPFIKNYLLDIYNGNSIIKILVDIIINIFKSFFSIFGKK